nr:MAG TPA: hypothetical protein [Caudoviricetes sp.]
MLCYLPFTHVSPCYRKCGGVVLSRFSRGENENNFSIPLK